jgi:hypothetical protein
MTQEAWARSFLDRLGLTEEEADQTGLWQQLEWEILSRNDPRAQGVRERLIGDDPAAADAALATMLGPDSPRIAILAPLGSVSDLLIDWMMHLKCLTERVESICTDPSEVERLKLELSGHQYRYKRAMGAIQQIATTVHALSRPRGAFPIPEDRCAHCGGVLIGRGKSPYCSEQHKAAAQKARQKAHARTSGPAQKSKKAARNP